MTVLLIVALVPIAAAFLWGFYGGWGPNNPA
jgi:uncharacterized membrane protein (Fun14 family)